ncbi:MAG: DEAD/DEAH box helicase [Clostridia bacterium]|nr:DEAD/DEAH box helicase [Clostridia bacterium]
MARDFSSRDAKNLITKHNALLSSLKDAAKLSGILKENIKKAADTLVVQEILTILRGVPVEELNREKNGIRVKALIDHNFTTMADLYVASVYNITAVRGISEDTAYTIKRIVNSFVEKTRNEIKIRLSVDNKNKYSANLVRAVSIYKNSLPHIQKCDDIIFDQSENIIDNIADLKPATNGLRWLFTSKSTKSKATEAYANLKELTDGSYGAEVRSTLSALNKLSNTSLEDAWSDFTLDNVRFYNILEETNPGLLGTDDALYGLPEDLARQIQDECFFPDGLKCTLRRYQEWGVKYILHQEKVLLGDEMGLGKTIQAIAAMVSLKNTGATHFVVVCPASVVTNWCREIAKHSLLRATKVHGNDRKNALKCWLRTGGVAVTTYETTPHFELENDFKFAMLVVDEAHYIKNPYAKRTIHTKALCRHAERLLFMTGTALENKVDEMISLISILQPKIAEQVQGLAFMASAPQFRNKVAPVYYRRKREDVLTELPELIESKEWCAMSKDEEQIYEDAILGKHFTEARRVSWNIDNLKNSSKANRLKEIVEEAEAEDRKVIVFSFFLDTIRKIHMFLGQRCLNPINGSVSPQRRQEIIDEFDKAPAGSVLVAQIQSGGTGLNIQSASVVVICEPQFKPSIENQAISRAYRMGQSRNVLVYRLLCENSIDERITELLEQKQAIFDAFADKSVSAQQSLEIDDKTFGEIISEEIARINEKRGISAANVLPSETGEK